MGLNNLVLRSNSQPLTDFTARPNRAGGIANGTFSASTPATGGSIASGYRMLRKNNTLAGREASNHFNGETDRRAGSSRLRMVSKLRKKERFMIWRNIWYDLTRYVITGFVRFSPFYLFRSNDIANSAVRFRGR